jgi:hypothetical protein
VSESEIIEAVKRLREWVADWSIGRFEKPQYANPTALKADITIVLNALENFLPSDTREGGRDDYTAEGAFADLIYVHAWLVQTDAPENIRTLVVRAASILRASPVPAVADGPEPVYVWTIDYDNECYGIYATKEAAEEGLARQIADGGPAWDNCEVHRCRAAGPGSRDTKEPTT